MKIKLEHLILTLLFSLTFFINSFSQKIKVGSRMPQFELMDQFGEYFNSLDYLNKQPLVVFFYTEDEAPTCTREVLEFNNKFEQFKELNAVVVGINPASIVYHRKFVIKLELKYPILFDRNSDTQKKFKVPNVKGTKNPQRYTFIVDKKGVVQKIFHSDNNAEIHIIESLKTLKDL
jgi:peroxiredoxin Q/BCP